MMKSFKLILMLFLIACSTQRIENHTSKFTAYDSQLSSFQYPYSVQFYATNVQNKNLEMAYMDVRPIGKINKTIVLLHGKNFSGFYFESIIKELLPLGYRIIVPDQVGFGKSSKPESLQYSFPLLAQLTNNLLDSINANEFILVGHSMGGMIATRFALMYPSKVTKLILVNPIGLEDYKDLAGYKTVDELFTMELTNNENKIREYQKNSYYAGVWKSEYDQMIAPAVGWTLGSDQKLIAMNSALTSEMIYSQPVVYEFKNLKMPTTLIIGQRDKTAIGKAWASSENQKLMGNYPHLGKLIASTIPHGKLIPLPGLGHLPFVEDFNGFMKIFLKELE